MKTTESLGYVCKATKQRHNATGLLYRHRWTTGYQDLIFASKEAAERFCGTDKTIQHAGQSHARLPSLT